MNSHAESNNQMSLLKVIKALILEYSQMPIKSKLFEKNLNLEIILGFTLSNVISGINIQISDLEKTMLHKSIQLAYKRKKKRLTNKEYLFSMVIVHHLHHIQSSYKQYCEFIKKLFAQIENCFVLFTDGSKVDNVFEDYNNYNFNIQNKIQKKQIKAILFWDDSLQVQQSQSIHFNIDQKQKKQAMTQSTAVSSMQSLIFPYQFKDSYLSKFKNNQKFLCYEDSQTTNDKQNIGIKIRKQLLEQIYKNIELFLAMCEIFHAHTHLSVCVYTLQQYLIFNLRDLQSKQTNQTKNMLIKQKIYEKLIKKNITDQRKYSIQLSSIYNQDDQISFDRPDIPTTAQFFVLKQRASKITKGELRQLQNIELDKYYQQNCDVHFLSYSKYLQGQKEHMNKLKQQLKEIGFIMMVSKGFDSLVLWVTFKGLPILKCLPSFEKKNIDFIGFSLSKNQNWIKKLNKILKEQKNELGFNKYSPKEKISSNKIQNSKLTQQYQDSDQDSLELQNSSNFRQQKQPVKNSQITPQKQTIYILDLYQIPDVSCSYFQTFMYKFQYLCCQHFHNRLQSAKKLERQKQRVNNITRIAQILSRVSSEAHQVPQKLLTQSVENQQGKTAWTNKINNDKDKMIEILMNKLYYDAL